MNNKLGEYIKSYRTEHGLSLREFAKLADISHTHIDSIEKGVDFRTGKPVRITNETIQKLAKALNQDESYLFQLSIGKEIPQSELNIGERIKQLRLEKGIDQLTLCEKLNIEQSTLSNYENGRRTPKPEIIVKIAEILDVSTDYLLGKTNLRNYADYKPTITAKDERNIQRDLEQMMADIDNKKSGPAAYGGELDLDDYDRELLKGSLEQVLRIIKLKNKETYTPNKYRHSTDD